MKLELEITIIANVELHTDAPGATEEQIRDTVMTHLRSGGGHTLDIEKVVRVMGHEHGPDLGWITDDYPVYNGECTNFQVEGWKIVKVNK